MATATSVRAQELLETNKPYTYLYTAPGYITINEISYGSSLGNVSFPYPKLYLGFTTIHGYQLTSKFIAGAGVGVSFYNGGTLFPLFIHLRYGFSSKPFAPFVFGDGGLIFSTESKAKLFINPGIGLRYAISHKVGINLSTSYLLKSGVSLDSYLSLRFGIIFKPTVPSN